MIEQIGNALSFYAFFVASKQGKTGLTVTTDVYNPAGSLVVNGGSASAVGGGIYKYTLASGSVTAEGEYIAIFKTADGTVDAQHIPALWVVGRGGVEDLDAAISSRSSHTAANVRTEMDASSTKLANLDAAISTRLATAGYTAPDNASVTAIKAKTDLLPASPAATGDIPTVGAVADAVWDELLAGHAGAGSAGAGLSAAGSAGDPWSTVVPGDYEAGTAGARFALIGTARVTVTSPVAANGTIALRQGDSYTTESGFPLEATETTGAWQAFVGLDAQFEVRATTGSGAVKLTAGAEIVDVDGTTALARVELTSEETATLKAGTYRFDVEVTVTGEEVRTIWAGTLTVAAD